MSMTFRFEIDARNPQLIHCKSDATSWDEMLPALMASWIRFAALLGESVPSDVRNEINLSFFPSSGRVTFGHGRRDFKITDYRWEQVPTDYIWNVMCQCRWVEEQWYGASGDDDTIDRTMGELGVAFAVHCLRAASHPDVAHEFTRNALAVNIPLRGQGITQSPAKFETTLDAVLKGFIPDISP